MATPPPSSRQTGWQGGHTWAPPVVPRPLLSHPDLADGGGLQPNSFNQF